MPALRRTAKLALIVGAGGVLASACGGSTQDAHEQEASHTLRVLRSSFPAKQAVARPTALELEILNPGSSTVPNVVVTVDSFYYRSNFPNLSTRLRPIWIVDHGPGAQPQRPVETLPLGGPGSYVTAGSSTWAAGPLLAGEARTFTWLLTPVKSGNHSVLYAVAAGLGGKARATLPSGAPVAGRFDVQIASAPPVNHVNPETGLVEPGRYPVAPGP